MGLTEKQQYDKDRYILRRDELLEKKRRTYDPVEERRKNLWRHYRLTPEEFDALLTSQNGVCGICGGPPTTGRWLVFAVDHCHATGAVRGLLCGKCNVGLGALGDTEEGLMRALAYIKNGSNV